MTKQCECCGQELTIVFPSTKYCSNCSLFVSKLRDKISLLEKTIEKKNKKKYKLSIYKK